MVKRVLGLIAGLVGLVILIAGASILVRTTFPAIAGQAPSLTDGSGLNLVCSPSLRPTGQSAPYVLQPMPTPNVSQPPQVAASQLERGPGVALPTLLAAVGRQAIGSQVILNNQLILSITDAEGWTCLFVSDLGGARSKQIATLGGMLGELAASGRYVVWTDNIYIAEESSASCTTEAPAPAPDAPAQTLAPPCPSTPARIRTEMHVYDRRASREVIQKEMTGRFFDLAENTLVWQEYRGAAWGIYGQDLDTGQTFTATTQSASYPRITGDWVAYVGSQESTNRLAVDLHLFNRRTGEDKLIGPVSNDPQGRGYAIGGDSLVWVKIPSSSPVVYELHVYTLDTGEDRQLDVSNKGYRSNLRLSGDLLIYAQEGWQAVDLQTGRVFTIFSSPVALELVPSLSISGNRIVWWMRDESSKTTQLYTTLVNPGQ